MSVSAKNESRSPKPFNLGSIDKIQAFNDEKKTVIWNKKEKKIVEIKEDRTVWQGLATLLKILFSRDLVSGDQARSEFKAAQKEAKEACKNVMEKTKNIDGITTDEIGKDTDLI